MAVAVTIKRAEQALAGLDAESRALLDLSLRRGMQDEEIGRVLRVDSSEVQRRVDDLLGKLADELGLEGREQRDELRATLPDLPPELWKG